MRMRFHEWWSRSLVPGQHYVEVTDNEAEMCDKVRWGRGCLLGLHALCHC